MCGEYSNEPCNVFFQIVKLNLYPLYSLERKNNDSLSQLKPKNSNDDAIYKSDIYKNSSYSMPKK